MSAAGGNGGATSVARRGLGVGGPGSVLRSLRNGAKRTLYTLPADSPNCGSGAGETWACAYASAGALVAVAAADALVNLVVAASAPRNATAQAGSTCGARGAPDCYESAYVLGQVSAQHGVYLGAAWPASDALFVRLSLSNAAERSASLTLDLKGGLLLSATGAIVGFTAPRVTLSSGGAVTMGATRVAAYSAARIVAGTNGGSLNGSISLINCSVSTGASDAKRAAQYPEEGVALSSTGSVVVSGASARLASCRAAVRVTSTAGDVTLEAGQHSTFDPPPLVECASTPGREWDALVTARSIAIGAKRNAFVNGSLCVYECGACCATWNPVEAVRSAVSRARWANETRTAVEVAANSGDVTLVANIDGRDGGVVLSAGGPQLSITTRHVHGTFISIDGASAVDVWAAELALSGEDGDVAAACVSSLASLSCALHWSRLRLPLLP